VGRKSTFIELSNDEKSLLELSHKKGEKHTFRQRCKIILLRNEGYTVAVISKIMDTTMSSVNNWLSRYTREGIDGLHTKEGQGRKPILEEEHYNIVRAAVEQERQRLEQAKKIVEDNIGKKMSASTLTRFLKVITAVTSE